MYNLVKTVRKENYERIGKESVMYLPFWLLALTFVGAVGFGAGWMNVIRNGATSGTIAFVMFTMAFLAFCSFRIVEWLLRGTPPHTHPELETDR